MNKLMLAVAAVTVLVLAGCDKTDKPAQGTAPTPSATVAELSDDEVPVAQDFLEEVTKEIDDSNYKAQIDAIEKDIASTND